MPDTPKREPAAPAYAAGDDPNELICLCDWPEKACREVFGKTCSHSAPGFRTRREIEPWLFAPKRRNAKKKGGAR